MKEFTVDPVGTPFMCYLYMIMGTVSALCNVLNLIVLLSSRELRHKYLFFIVLDFGELVHAIAYLLTGIGRYSEYQAGTLVNQLSIHDCFFKHFWPQTLILGTQLTALAIIIIAVERILAVSLPFTFKKWFGGSTKWFFVAVIPLFALISLALAAFSAILVGNELVSTQHCGIITSTAKWYSTFHFSFVVLAYLSSFMSLLVVWKVFTEKGERVRGHRRLLMMLIIVGISSIFVAVPSAIHILIRWQIVDFSDLSISITYIFPGLISVTTTGVNFIMQEDVRFQLLYILGCRKDNLMKKNWSVKQIALQTHSSNSPRGSNKF